MSTRAWWGRLGTRELQPVIAGALGTRRAKRGSAPAAGLSVLGGCAAQRRALPANKRGTLRAGLHREAREMARQLSQLSGLNPESRIRQRAVGPGK